MNYLSQNFLIIQLTFWRTNHIIKRHSFISESENKDSALISLINSDIRNDSIETSEHNSVKKSDLKTTSKFLFNSMTYNDEATIQSQQDNTSSVSNTSRTKSFKALNPESTFMNFRAKMQASLNDFHLFLWLTVMSEKTDNSKGNSENSFKDDNNIKNTWCVNSIKRSFDVNTDRLNSLFSDMQHFIYSVKSKKHSVYKQCSSFTVQEVEAQLTQIEWKEEEENCKERKERCDTENCNKDNCKKRSCDRESCDRESCDRESHNKDDCDKESCDKES